MSQFRHKIITNSANNTSYICNTQNLLGQGLICKVYEAKIMDTNKYVALKQISKKPEQYEKVTASKLKQSYNLEIEILKLCQKKQNQNIISLLDNFETEDHFYIVLELCDCNLREYLEKKQGKRLEEKEAIDILAQIVRGENYLHENKYCHRDIKPANILLLGGCVKITDVNLAKYIEDMYQVAAHSSVGTPFYQAPEVNSKKEYCPYKADIYSLGVVLYEMLYGLVDKIEGINNFQKKMKDSQLQINKDLEDLIIKMVDLDPKNRVDWPYVSACIQAYANSKLRFLNGIIDDLSQLLKVIKDQDIINLLYPTGLLIIKFFNQLIQEKTIELQKINKHQDAKDMKEHQDLKFYLQNTKNWYDSQTAAQKPMLCQSSDLKDEFRHNERNKNFIKHFQCYLAAFFYKLDNLKFEKKEQNLDIKYLQLKILIVCDSINNFKKVQQLLAQNNLHFEEQNIIGLCQNLQDIQKIEEYKTALLPIVDQIHKGL